MVGAVFNCADAVTNRIYQEVGAVFNCAGAVKNRTYRAS